MRHTYTHISNFSIKKGPFDFFGEINDFSSKISVGHDVWIGERVSVLPGVKFGNGSVVGAGSIVTKSTRPFGIYAGNPARLIKFRFDRKKISFFNKIKWWNFPFMKLRKLKDKFKKPIDNIPIDALEKML